MGLESGTKKSKEKKREGRGSEVEMSDPGVGREDRESETKHSIDGERSDDGPSPSKRPRLDVPHGKGQEWAQSKRILALDNICNQGKRLLDVCSSLHIPVGTLGPWKLLLSGTESQALPKGGSVSGGRPQKMTDALKIKVIAIASRKSIYTLKDIREYTILDLVEGGMQGLFCHAKSQKWWRCKIFL